MQAAPRGRNLGLKITAMIISKYPFICFNQGSGNRIVKMLAIWGTELQSNHFKHTTSAVISTKMGKNLHCEVWLFGSTLKSFAGFLISFTL